MVIAAVLYGPLLLAAISLVIVFRAQASSYTTFTVQPFAIFGVSFPIKNQIIIKLLAAATACAFVSLYWFYDYSSFFPSFLEMDVYFDRPGVIRSVNEILSKADQTELNIVPADPINRKRYFDTLDSEVRLALGRSSFFSMIDGDVHSTGETSFKIKKLDGWQRYYIAESRGEITNVLDAPHIPETQFITFFDKLPTSDDYIQPTPWQLFVKGEVLIHPHFRESLAEYRTSKSVSFNVAVVGITKIYIVPWPHFSSTIYCGDLQGVGLVPIAYAIYRAE